MSLLATWNDARQALAARRAEIDALIASYPPPIPACDAQFNHLLEQRREIGQELVRLEDAMARGDKVDAFLKSSHALDITGEEKQQ